MFSRPIATSSLDAMTLQQTASCRASHDPV
jgi:hypothetical protein